MNRIHSAENPSSGQSVGSVGSGGSLSRPDTVISARDLCVAQVPLFSGLSDEQLFRVAERATRIVRRQGETIHSPGSSLSHLFVVHQGRVRVANVDPSGAERLIRVLDPGDFVGEASFVTGARPETEATALTDVELCSFDHRMFQDLVDEYPRINQQMLRTLSARLEQAERFIAEVTTAPVATRVARYLVDLPVTRARKSGAGGDGDPLATSLIVLPLAKKDIASLLGMTPETLSRQFAALERDGVIRVGAEGLELCDGEALLERATI